MNIDEMSKLIAKKLYIDPFTDVCPSCAEMPITEMTNYEGIGIRPEKYSKTQFEIIKQALNEIKER
jgi:hypothetical protein